MNRMIEEQEVAEQFEKYYERTKKATNKFCSKIRKTPQEILENNMGVFCREDGVSAEDLNNYLGERGVLYIIDVLEDRVRNKDVVGCLMLSQVIEHLCNQIKEKEQEIAQNG